MRVREDYRSLTGPEKAAILMLSLGEEHAARLFELMDDEEIREISQTMANLGTVSSNLVERLFVEFAEQFSQGGSLVGSMDSTERLMCELTVKDGRIVYDLNGISRPDWKTLPEGYGPIGDGRWDGLNPARGTTPGQRGRGGVPPGATPSRR